MSELDGVRTSLVQTQALERVQEIARRLGDNQQQSFATSLNRQVDTREHQVNRGEEAQPETLDADTRKEREETLRRRAAGGPEDEEQVEGEDDPLGRHIDVRA